MARQLWPFPIPCIWCWQSKRKSWKSRWFFSCDLIWMPLKDASVLLVVPFSHLVPHRLLSPHNRRGLNVVFCPRVPTCPWASHGALIRVISEVKIRLSNRNKEPLLPSPRPTIIVSVFHAIGCSCVHEQSGVSSSWKKTKKTKQNTVTLI